MLIIETRYSMYEIEEVEKGLYAITKIGATSFSKPYPFMALGEVRYSRIAKIKIGQQAQFEGWFTSEVIDWCHPLCPCHHAGTNYHATRHPR